MKVHIFSDIPRNFSGYTKFLISIQEKIEKSFIEYNVDVNIILVNLEKIHALNKEFRNVDAPTDVLSFNFEKYNNDSASMEAGDVVDLNDSAVHGNLLGEVYISPEYIENTIGGAGIGRKDIIENKDNNRVIYTEILRMTLHGILHLLGYEHKGYFMEECFENGKSTCGENEEIFIEQEKRLYDILNSAEK